MSPPSPPARHWTIRALAGATGISIKSVHRTLRRHQLQPHWVKTFKVSRDPNVEEKIQDVVGLYCNPPDHAVVLSVDEKTRIQALARTRNPLPMKAEHPETPTTTSAWEPTVSRLP